MILEKANVGVLPKFYLKMNYRGYLVLDYLCVSYNHFHIKEKINVHRHANYIHRSIASSVTLIMCTIGSHPHTAKKKPGDAAVVPSPSCSTIAVTEVSG